MTVEWWDRAWNEPEFYDGLSEKQKERLAEVTDFLSNNCPGWFEGSGRPRQALTEVLCRLPDDAADVLLSNTDIIVIDGSSSAAWSWRYVCLSHPETVSKWLYIIVLRKELRDMPYEVAVGEVAHELAHVFLGHRLDAPETAQEEGDAIARQWGFRDEIDLLNRRPMTCPTPKQIQPQC